MGEVVLGTTFHRGTQIIGCGIVGQTTCLTQFLEDDAVHAGTEILIEECLYCRTLRIPLRSVIVIHAHIDVLGIIRRNPYFVLRSNLLEIRFPFDCRHSLAGHLMVLGQHGIQRLLRLRTIIQDCMLVVEELSHEGNELLWLGLPQLLFVHHITCTVVLAKDAIGAESAIAASLILLAVRTIFQNQLHHLLIGILIGLCVAQLILQSLQGGHHILVQSAQGDGDMVIINIDAVATCQLIELLLLLDGIELLRAEIFQIVGCYLIALV